MLLRHYVGQGVALQIAKRMVDTYVGLQIYNIVDDVSFTTVGPPGFVDRNLRFFDLTMQVDKSVILALPAAWATARLS